MVADLADAIRAQRVAVFCGAGISANSGLPVANALIDRLSAQLPWTDSDGTNLGRPQLPFEYFLQMLSENSSIEKIVRLFGAGSPTLTHQFLAKLVRAGCLRTIYTTNFDTLIERALLAEGLKRPHDYERVYRPSSFKLALGIRDQPMLVKLHGTFEHQDSVATTLRSVALRQHVPEQAALIQALFAGEANEIVLVVGYSGSDKFDIMPQISKVAGISRPTLLINHTPGRPVKDSIVATRGSIARDSPWRTLPSIVEMSVDANLLVKELWERLIDEPYNDERRATRWENYVDRWGTDLRAGGAANPYRIAARLCEEGGQTQRSRHYFSRALVMVSDEYETRLRFRIHGDLGRVSNSLGDYRAAIAHGRRALSGAHRLGDVERTAAELGNIGLAFYNLGRHARALKLHRRAWRLARSVGADQIRANQLGNIGLVYRRMGRYSRAAKCHLSSIRLNKLRGSLRQEAAQLANLGLCCEYVGDLRESEKCHAEALTIFEQVGDPRRASIQLGNLAKICKQRSDHRGALHLLRRALAGARIADDARAIFDQLNGIAEVILDAGKPSRAAIVGERALKLAGEIEHRYSMGAANVTVGSARLALGDLTTARHHAETALKLLAPLVPADHPYRRRAEALLMAAIPSA